MRKTPGFTAAAILTLALGIGANTAIFSMLEGVVLRPLPYRQPDRLVLLLVYNQRLKYATLLSYPDFLDWQRSAGSFEQIAALRPQGFDLSSPGMPEHVDGKEVSSNFSRTLGVKLALGRDFLPEEDKTGGMPALGIGAPFLAAVVSDNAQTYTFDPHGSTATMRNSINAKGEIAGTYLDAGYAFHGFVRSLAGRHQDIRSHWQHQYASLQHQRWWRNCRVLHRRQPCATRVYSRPAGHRQLVRPDWEHRDQVLLK